MASLLSPDDPLNANPSTGGGSTTTSGTGSTGSGSSPTGGTIGAPDSPKASATGIANQQDVAKIGDLNQGFDFSPLLNNIQGQGTQARSAIAGADTDFTNQLGNFTPFGTDAQNTLSGVLAGNTPMQTGRDLLNTSYTGPTGANNATYDPFIQKYQNSAAQTNNQTGLDALLGGARPDLTPGERSFDTTTYLQNPNYKAASQGLINDSNDVFNLGQQQTQGELGRIAQRQSDIAGFDTAGTNWVTGQRDAVNNAINDQVTNANSSDANTQNIINQIKAGTMRWQDAPAGTFNFDTSQLTPQNFDFTPLGQPANSEPIPRHYDTRDPGDSGKIAQNVFAMLSNKQPAVLPYPELGLGDPKPEPTGFNSLVDPTSYLSNTPFGQATRENMAQAPQVTQYNNAEDLLNLTDRLSPTTRAGGNISFDTNAFQTALANAKAKLSDAQAQDAAFQKQFRPVAPVAAVQPSLSELWANQGYGGGSGGT